MTFVRTGIQNEVVKAVHKDSSIFCTVTFPVCLSLVQTHSVLNKELYSSLLHIMAYAQQSRKANVITYESDELKDLVGGFSWCYTSTNVIFKCLKKKGICNFPPFIKTII